MNSCFRLAALSLIVIPLMNAACAKKSSTPNASDAASAAPFTASDLASNRYKSTCQSGSTDPMTGGTGYIVSITFLSDGTTANFSQEWYPNTSCTGLINAMYSVTAGYTVGSGSPQSMVFTVSSSRIMVGSTAMQTIVNTACGGTSPYDGNVNSSNDGVSKSSYMMTCSSMTFPNSGNKTVNQVAALSGTVLWFGAGYSGIPGQFSGNTAPTSVSVALSKY